LVGRGKELIFSIKLVTKTDSPTDLFSALPLLSFVNP